MATNKIIAVITIPTKTGDTVASYNAYSSVDGSLGSLTPAEALSGKIFALSDGASHNVTVKTVWTISGESTTNVSNVVVVDFSSIIIFEDDFTGSTIDVVTNWDLQNLDSGIVVFTQNNQLSIASTANGASSGDNYLESQDTFDLSSTKVLSFDLQVDDSDAIAGFSIGFQSNTSFDDLVRIQQGDANGEIKIRVRSVATDATFTNYSVDVSTSKTFKIVVSATGVTFNWWNGSSWTQLEEVLGALSHVLPVFISQGGNAAGAINSVYDNVTVSSEDFATQYPV